jgi:hypothetical protein
MATDTNDTDLYSLSSTAVALNDALNELLVSGELDQDHKELLLVCFTHDPNPNCLFFIALPNRSYIGISTHDACEKN